MYTAFLKCSTQLIISEIFYFRQINKSCFIFLEDTSIELTGEWGAIFKGEFELP